LQPHNVNPMKNTNLGSIIAFLIFYLVLSNFPTNAANPNNLAEGYTATYMITNEVIVSDRILEFDLYLKASDAGKPFEISIIQAGILVNTDIINGGDITASLVPGLSELVSVQQPTTVLFVKKPGKSIIKMAGKIGPGKGNGTVIKTTGHGTRICRIRLTNTTPFAKAHADLTFCFTTDPYPTKVFYYDGRMSNQLETNPKNCFSEAANPVLNQ
jgi:hypothetical protein